MRGLIALLIAIVCFGCAENKLQPVNPSNIGPETIVVPVPQNPIKRTDLPLNWIQVDGKGWSYGLPAGFDKKLQPAGILASHYSTNTGITINFTTHENKDQLKTYVYAFLQKVESKGAVHASAINDRLGIIAVYLFMNDESNPPAIKSSLDFFKQKDTTVYHMTCESNVERLAENSDICFDVAETIRIE